MKIDMHCHVHEGSIDSRVSLDEYITVLKEKGFDGNADHGPRQLSWLQALEIRNERESSPGFRSFERH